MARHRPWLFQEATRDIVAEWAAEVSEDGNQLTGTWCIRGGDVGGSLVGVRRAAWLASSAPVPALFLMRSNRWHIYRL
jgi:hypothetical protein